MTAQVPEKLIYQGEAMDMYTEPLHEYLAKSGRNIGFKVTNSGLWRGYVGQWEVVEGKLYLIDIRGTLKNGNKVSLSTLSNTSDMILAYWYSGTLRIPRGQQLRYSRDPFERIYEHELLLEVLQGDVVATRLQRNEVEDLVDDDELPF
ncbi:MAG: hypothetical protein CMN15_02930 [Roseovarius sp.]|nr:hypothetical protein [Roseovarius sp.]|tara:strand:- start:6962 stop:7405 length:444 start_codon:yes stop_codon:yes gene_type:complete